MKKTARPIIYVGDILALKAPLKFEKDTPLSFSILAMNVVKTAAAGIVDSKARCIGFITYDDVMNYIADESIDAESTYVGDVMRPLDMIMHSNDLAEDAITIMDSHKLDWLPVVGHKNRSFEGLICSKDLKETSVVIAFSKMKCTGDFLAINNA